jgi:hypothetical protein
MSFIKIQKQLADHLRNPDVHSPPENIEDRRLNIYRDLVFNNIESFLSGGFPILHSIYSEENWLNLVRDFIKIHKAESPYFLEISQEFLRYLQEERVAENSDPAFLIELAHYEWVELALDVSTDVLPTQDKCVEDLLEQLPTVSPLAWCLSYQFPVHKIGPDYQPETPPESPTFLIVYRDGNQQVQFMESNAVTIRLLNIIAACEVDSGKAALQCLAGEMQHPNPDELVQMGHQIMRQLQQSSILF